MGRACTLRSPVKGSAFRSGLLVIACGVLLSLVACFDMCRSDLVIATSNEGAILESEYVSWLEFKRHDDGGEFCLEEINNLVLTKKFAAEAVTLGLDQRASVRKQINAAENDIHARTINSHLAHKIAIIEEDLKAYYTHNIENFRSPSRVETQLIFLKAPALASSTARDVVHQRLETLRTRVLKGEDFETLAKEYSESQTRAQGGYIGALAPEQFKEPVYSALKSLASGDISKIIDLGEGFGLFRAKAILPAVEQRYEDARSTIEETLRRRALKAEQSALDERLSTQINFDIPSTGLILSSETDERVLAHYPGGAIRVDDILLDLANNGREEQGIISERELRQTSQRLALIKLKAAESRLRGLSDSPDVRARTEWSRLRVLAQAAIEEKINERSPGMSEEAIDDFIESNPERVKSQAYYGLSVIFEFTDKAHLEKDLQRLQSVARKMQLGMLDFDTQATNNEALPESITNLDLTAVSQQNLNLFGGAAAREIHLLKQTQITNLVRQSFRLWIFRLDTFHPAGPLPSDAARGRAATIIKQQQHRSLEAAIRSDVINNANIRIVEKTDT